MGRDVRLWDFEPVSREAWVERAERDLRGRGLSSLRVPVDGVDVEALYTAQDLAAISVIDSMPGAYPFVRGRTPLGPGADGWRTEPEYDHANPADVSAIMRVDLEHGAHAPWFLLAGHLRAAHPEYGGAPGIVLDRQAAMARLLRDLDLAATPLYFQAGAAGVPTAAMVAGVVGDATPGLRGGILGDPIAELARVGRLGVSVERALDDVAELLTWSGVRAPALAAVGVCTVAHHEAGASAVTELAVALATGVEYLRAMQARGIGPELVAPRMLFRFAVGRDLFTNVAKLRAARLVWARVCETCGLRGSEGAMRLHVRGSGRARTRRDPWVNLLRGTIETFSAVIGGADGIATTPMDAAFGPANAFSSRMSINTQVLLREESHLGAVVDAGGGSYYIEARTHALADAAWAMFREMERDGGLVRVLESGSLQRTIEDSAAAWGDAVARGGVEITGVSKFAALDERPVEREPARPLPASVRGAGTPSDPTALGARLGALARAGVGHRVSAASEALAAGATLRDIFGARPDSRRPAEVRPLVELRLAAPFERLRDRADALTERIGQRPRVLLACIGPMKEISARVDFVRDLLAAGGLETETQEGVESLEESAASSRPAVAVICGTDDRYATSVPSLVPALRASGAEHILLAGRPGDRREAFEAAGVDEFVHTGCDAPAILGRILERLESA